MTETSASRQETPKPRSVAIKQYNWGWLAGVRGDIGEKPGLMRIYEDGIIKLSHGLEDGGYGQPRVQEIFTTARTVLKDQGVELPPPKISYPHTEGLLNKVDEKETVDLDQIDLKEGDYVILTGEGENLPPGQHFTPLHRSYHPHPPIDRKVTYVGQVLKAEKHSIDKGQISEKMKIEFDPESTWQLEYSHFTPDEDHITYIHGPDVEDAVAEKNRVSQAWNMRAFRVDQAFLDAIASEVADSATSRRTFSRGGHLSEADWDEVEFMGELEKKG